jgi:hypothetical protein
MLNMPDLPQDLYIPTYTVVTVPQLFHIGEPQYSYGLKRKSDFEENLN